MHSYHMIISPKVVQKNGHTDDVILPYLDMYDKCIYIRQYHMIASPKVVQKKCSHG